MTPRLQTIAGLVVYVTAIAALVVLALTGHDAQITDVLTLAGPVVAGLLVNGAIAARLDPIHRQVTKIDEQTNGVLDERIAEGVRRGLLSHQAQPRPLHPGHLEGTG